MHLTIKAETFPVAGTFTISRGSRTEIHVVTVTLDDGVYQGRGECVPYARNGETVEGVMGQIKGLEDDIASGLDRSALQSYLPAGAARNALDCAFWDLEAKQSEKRIWELLKRAQPDHVISTYTLSLDTPDNMEEAARMHADWPVLKVKLGGEGDTARLMAVRHGAPNAALIVDANEGWRAENITDHMQLCADLGVALIEQPLPAGQDAILAEIDRKVPICADESVHIMDDILHLKERYDVINIKLDKSGGLTEALKMQEKAKAIGIHVMVGCMLGTSLAMAPAMILADQAIFVDLDGPLLLARDRQPAIHYNGPRMEPPSMSLWG